MKQIAALFLALVIVVAGRSPALAHRPYFTQVEKIRLPNGDIGEVRLINGDGIFGPDPVRVLILDPQGHLLARSPKSFSIRISCGDDGDCLILDLTHDKVLELEAASFRRGDRVPGLSTDDRNDLWDLEDGNDAWGFRIRALSLRERPASVSALMLEHFPMMTINALAGGFCGWLGVAAWLIVRAKRTRVAQTLLAIAGALLLAVASLFAVLMSFLLSAISALPFAVWIVSLATGAALSITGYCVVRFIKNDSASSEGSTP